MPDAAHEEKRKWSFKRKLLVFVGLPLVLLLCVGLLLDAMAGGRLKTAKQRAGADGGPVTFAELEAARKVWPDAENGALVIVALETQLEAIGNSDSIQALPPFAEDRPPLGYRFADEELAAAKAELQRLQPELDAIGRLREFQGGRFPMTISANPIETLLPQLGPLRMSVKLVSARAEVEAMEGNTTGLVDAVDLGFRHAQLVADEPILISGLVSIAREGLALDTIERVMGLTTLSAEQLTQLDHLLAGREGRNRLLWAMRGERACFLGTVEYARANGWGALEAIAGVGSDPTGGSATANGALRHIGWIPGLRGVLMRDEAAGLDLYNRMVAAAKDPRQNAAMFQQVENEVGQLPPYFVLSRMLIPSVGRAFMLETRADAEIVTTRTALAVEHYRLDTGHFPKSLDELVPKYLDSVPQDPFAAGPLRYREDEGGVVIYSVSDDGQDDGGLVTYRVAKPSDTKDWGVVLLPVAQRGKVATRPATEPAEDQ